MKYRTLQEDLFGAPTFVATEVLPDPEPVKKARQRNVSRNALDARDRTKKGERKNKDEDILAEIVGSSKGGRTYKEINARTGIPVTTICWAFNRLLEAKKIFRRVLTVGGGFEVAYKDVSAHGKRPRFDSRDGCYVVYAALYTEWFESAAARRTA